MYDGGSDEDRSRLLELHAAYLEANATFDVPALRKIWSEDPTAVFFNLNGHTYVGVEHWTRLWNYYQSRLQTGLWTPSEVKVMVRGDMAVITCHRLSPAAWVGWPLATPARRWRTSRSGTSATSATPRRSA